MSEIFPHGDDVTHRLLKCFIYYNIYDTIDVLLMVVVVVNRLLEVETSNGNECGTSSASSVTANWVIEAAELSIDLKSEIIQQICLKRDSKDSPQQRPLSNLSSLILFISSPSSSAH